MAQRRSLTGSIPLVLVVLVLASCSGSDQAVDTTTTTEAATTTTEATTTTTEATTTTNPDSALEAELIAEIEALAVALDSGDPDTYLGLLQPSLSDPELDRAAFFAVSAPMHVLVDECEMLSISDFVSEAGCPVEITEPVRLEFGPPEGGIKVTRYGDGLSPIGDGTLDGRQYTNSSDAYAAYLQQYMPDEYAAACDRDGYDREIRFEHSVSLTRECGELLAEVADDVAHWIREGQPSP